MMLVWGALLVFGGVLADLPGLWLVGVFWIGYWFGEESER